MRSCKFFVCPNCGYDEKFKIFTSNEKIIVKVAEHVKQQNAAEKHCIETDAVGRKAKKRRMHPIRTRTKKYQI